MVLPLQPSMLENSFSSTERDNDQDQQPVSPQQQQQQNPEKLAAVQHVSVADSFPFPHSQQHSHISLFPFAKPQHAHQHHNHVDLKIHIPTSSSSQFIPTNSSSDSTPDPSPPSSLSSSASRSDYLPHSTSYSDLTPLPSPLVPADSTAAIFKAFNGQSPPSTAISRAPSVRTKGFRYVGPSASRQHKHTQASSSTAALMMAASMGKNPSISPSLSARMDDDNPISHLHLNDHTNAYRQHNEDYFSHTQYPDSKSTLKNILYNSTVNEVQQPNQHHLLSSPLINSSQDSATNNRVFPNHYLASTPEENTEVYSHNQNSKSVSPRHSKYNNSRSISEYVPQPINFMKYQLPVLSPSPRSQRQRPVPPPSSSDTITVEKRKTPSKSHDQQFINSMNDGPHNGDEKNSQFVAPVSTNITPEDSTIVGSPSTPTPKVQPRSLSSGSSAHGQKIHREAHTTTSSPVSSKKSISKLSAAPHMDPVVSNIGSGISGLFKNHSNKDLASENTKPIDESSRVSSTVTLTPTATEYSVNNDFPNSSTPTPQPPSVDKNSLSTTSLNSSISDKNINISNISNSSSSSIISGNTGKVENIRVANSSSGSISITSNSSNNYTSSPSILSKSTSSPTSTNFSSPISSPSAQYYFSATNNSSQFSQPSTTTASTSSLNNVTIPVSPSSGNNSILQDGTLPRSKPSSATNLLNSGNSTEENHSLIINGLAGNDSILSTSDANNAENVTFSEPLVTLTPTPVTHNRDIVAEAAKITTNIESQNNHGFVVSATNGAYDVTCDDPSSIKSSSTSSTSSTSSGSIQSTTSTTTSSSSVIHTSAADVSSKATVAPSTQVEKDEDANMSNTTLVVEDTSMEDVETEIKYPERVYEAYDINMKKSTWNEIEKLGSGAFSRVLLACPADRYLKPEYQGRSMDYKVAIKVVDMQGTAHEEDTYTRGHRRTESAHHHKHSRERMESGLKREIEILKKLFHPSLIRMYAFNIDSKSALMVLPLCRGGDLFELISKHRSEMSCALIRRIFGEICRAVCYLHKNNVVHRDIKLENVLLNLPVEEMLRLSGVNSSIDEERSRLEIENYPKAMATLTDMGLSREIDPEDPLLSTRCGSVDYVPPELLMGQTYDGRQTDSWALGVLLYAMMEGRLPFDPPINSNGKAVRGKVTHRIAKVEWSWVAFQDHEEEFERDGKTEEDAATDWMGGIWIVEGALRRRDARLLTTEMVEQPWVKGCAPEKLEYAWMMDINEIFK